MNVPILMHVLQAFLDFAFSYIRMCFLDGHILADLPNDVYESSDGIIWPVSPTSHQTWTTADFLIAKQPDSPSSRCLSTVKGSLSHTILGRFSRSLGKVIESVSSTDMFVLLLPRFGCLETLAYRIHEDWARCVWADIAGIEDLHPNTRGRDEPWTIFKTLLFTMTMIFSSLISLMNSMPLSTSRAPSEPILNLASCALRTFSSIYFVTSKFGTNGFGAYQNVWYGAVDLVNRAPPAKIEQIAKTCEPYFEVTERRDTVLSRVLPRTRMTYWLNLVEQLILPMPEDYLSVTVIPALRPYVTSDYVICQKH